MLAHGNFSLMPCSYSKGLRAILLAPGSRYALVERLGQDFGFRIRVHDWLRGGRGSH